LWLGAYGGFRGERAQIYEGGRHQSASHIALALAGRPLPTGLWALHRCDQPACVNPDHLFAGTPKDNMVDMVRKNRHDPHRGEHSTAAKLDWATVEEIRRLKGVVSELNLSKRYGMAPSSIHKILTGKAWRVG